VNKADEKILNDLNKKFDGKIYLECEITGLWVQKNLDYQGV